MAVASRGGRPRRASSAELPREAIRSLVRQCLLDKFARLRELGAARLIVGFDLGAAFLDLRLAPITGLLHLLAQVGNLRIRLALQLLLPRLGLRSRRLQLLLHRCDLLLQLGLALGTRLRQFSSSCCSSASNAADSRTS